MSGAVMAGLCAGSGAGGGGGGTGHVPNIMAWANIFGLDSGANAPLTISGVGGGTAPLSAAITGSATLTVIKNGVSFTYAGAFAVADGDKLACGVFANATTSGTITITSGGIAVGSFSYVVKSSGGGGYF